MAVSFAFRSQTGEGLTRILDGLDRYGARGIFFFAPEDLAARDDEIRRLTATGHKVGLLLDGADTETCMEQAGEGNRLLKHIARTRTDFLLVEAEDPAEELEGRGWICWDGNVDGIPGEETTASRLASDLRRSLSRLSGEGRVTMDDSEVSAAALERLLSQLTADRYTFKTVTEADG